MFARVFVLRAGKPATAEPLKLIATASGFDLTVALLQTDANGYAVFDVAELVERFGIAELPEVRSGDSSVRGELTQHIPKLAHLQIVPLRVPEHAQDVLPILALFRGRKPAIIELPSSSDAAHDCGCAATTPNLPSFQGFEPLDTRLSPHSFGRTPKLDGASDTCAPLVPSTVAARDYAVTQIVYPPHYEARVRGAPEVLLNTYRVRWEPAGFGLGDLLYSLPLAPCETVKIAVIDWSRRDSARKAQATQFDQSLAHQLNRERIVDEAMSTAMNMAQSSTSVHASATAGFAGFGMSVGAAHSSQEGNRNLAGQTTNRLADAVNQGGTEARSFASTVVTEARQDEASRAETRSVSNHNHCHSLTVHYFEVLRQFRVLTRWESQRPVFLLRPNPIPWTESAVFSQRALLRDVILDPELQPALDALRPPRSAAASHALGAGVVDADFGLTTITLDFDRFGGGVRSPLGVHFDISARGVGSTGEFELRWSDEVIPDLGGLVTVLDSDLNSFPQPPKRRTFDFPLSSADITGEVTSVTPSEVHSIEIRIRFDEVPNGLQVEWPIVMSGLRIRFAGTGSDASATIDRSALQVELPAEAPVPENGLLFSHDISAGSGDGSTAAASAHDPAADRQRLIDQLLTHINQNSLHYSMAYALYGTPEFGEGMLSAAGLTDAALNAPVPVSGGFLAFPKRLSDDEQVRLERLMQADRDRVLAERMVALPSGGVHAEAMMGACNSCEKRDATRFWDWQESPCPDRAPEISPVTTGSRFQSPDLSAQAMPNGVLNIVNPPAAPAPTGLAPALNALAMASLPDTTSKLLREGIKAASAASQPRRLADIKSIIENADIPDAKKAALIERAIDSTIRPDNPATDGTGSSGSDSDVVTVSAQHINPLDNPFVAAALELGTPNPFKLVLTNNEIVVAYKVLSGGEAWSYWSNNKFQFVLQTILGLGRSQLFEVVIGSIASTAVLGVAAVLTFIAAIVAGVAALYVISQDYSQDIRRLLAVAFAIVHAATGRKDLPKCPDALVANAAGDEDERKSFVKEWDDAAKGFRRELENAERNLEKILSAFAPGSTWDDLPVTVKQKIAEEMKPVIAVATVRAMMDKSEHVDEERAVKIMALVIAKASKKPTAGRLARNIREDYHRIRWPSENTGLEVV